MVVEAEDTAKPPPGRLLNATAARGADVASLDRTFGSTARTSARNAVASGHTVVSSSATATRSGIDSSSACAGAANRRTLAVNEARSKVADSGEGRADSDEGAMASVGQVDHRFGQPPTTTARGRGATPLDERTRLSARTTLGGPNPEAEI